MVATRPADSNPEKNRVASAGTTVLEGNAARSIEVSGGATADEAFDGQLIEKDPPLRPASRFVPPPPEMSSEKKEQMLARQNGKSYRKPRSKMRQGTLPLDIVSKGRFEKSEPTIHHGEDLDVPTYIRRGVPLN